MTLSLLLAIACGTETPTEPVLETPTEVEVETAPEAPSAEEVPPAVEGLPEEPPQLGAPQLGAPGISPVLGGGPPQLGGAPMRPGGLRPPTLSPKK